MVHGILVAAMVALALISGGATAADRSRPAQPNVVYIVADDLGWKDVGFHGSDIKTPNLDTLAAGGTRLEGFYTQPMCTPTRAALLTGRYPMRYGLQTAAIPSAATYGLATDEYLLSQALQQAGYETAIVGKWHLGHADRKYWPMGRGFDSQYGPLLGEIDYFTHAAHGQRDWFRNEKPVKEEGYVTTLFGTEAARVIRDHDPNKPLFLYLAFTAPHAPYQAPPAYLDRYAHVADPSRRAYAAMVTAMDDEIGRVVQALEERGMRENTLIVFHSDNGGPRSAKFTGEVDTSKGTIPCDNGPWRDGKGTVYEGGVRVVALANWPGHVPAGATVPGPIHVVDMYPTLAELTGASTAKTKPLDGLNVWAAIAEGKPSPRTEVVYNVEPFVAGVREGDWKLVWGAALPSRVELFDLAKDPGEQHDVAAANPAEVTALKARAEDLARQSVPPLLLKDVMAVSRRDLMGSVSLPEAAEAIELQP